MSVSSSRTLSLFLALFAAAALSSACEDAPAPPKPQSGSTSAQAAPASSATASATPTQDPQAAAQKIGEGAATAVLKGLGGQMKKAMGSDGPEHAIEFCSEKALTLTGELAAGKHPGVEVKRVSSRIRNPENTPDALERKALAHFEGEVAKKQKLSAHLMQKVDGGYRYYRPLVIGGGCLTCHGQPEVIPAGVKSKLQKQYPKDQATGYQAGELRGLIRVFVPTSALGGQPG